jgi:hypothetical protein
MYNKHYTYKSSKIIKKIQMSYNEYIPCCNDVQITNVQKEQYINTNLGCIYNGGCSSLVAPFLMHVGYYLCLSLSLSLSLSLW